MVLVEDAGESISSSDGEVIQSVRFDDRRGEWATWGCALQGVVCPVVVIERFEFAQDVQQVVWRAKTHHNCGDLRFRCRPVIMA